MLNAPLQNLDAWIIYLGHAQLPVLRVTLGEIERLSANEDNITPRDLAQCMLHDAMFTLKVLHFLQTHRTRKQQTDVTTVLHGLLMLGTTPFLQHFRVQPMLEDSLATETLALEGVQRVMYRARHAAVLARDIAFFRHDVEAEEVMVGALLHDVAEILLWCFAPALAQKIRALQQENVHLRSADAQRQILGFPLHELQQRLVEEWHLPLILRQLMDDRESESPRVANVAVAVNLARHAANGWGDAALPDDYAALARLLKTDMDDVRALVWRASLHTAREWRWYQGYPALASVPATELLR